MGELSRRTVVSSADRVFVIRQNSLESSPFTLTVSNNTGLATLGPVTISAPYRDGHIPISIGDVTAAGRAVDTTAADLVTLSSLDPLPDGGSVSFDCTAHSRSYSDQPYSTVESWLTFSIAAPGTQSTSFVQFVATVP